MQDPILIAALLVSAALLEILLWLWMPAWYYRHGIPLFTKTVQVSMPASKTISESNLREWVPDSKWGGFRFKALGSGQWAMREKFTGLQQYTPVMHATLSLDNATGVGHLVGRANLFVTTFLLAGTAGTIASEGKFKWLVLFGLLAICALNYLLQAYRYSTFLDRAWNARQALNS
jgi:hypothetical protein